MICARPIRFTADLAAHRRYLDALGATRVTTAPGWEVYALGSGRLALHEASEHQPPGDVLAFGVADLDEWARRAGDAGLPFEVGQTDHGIAATVRAPDGTTFTVDPAPVAAQPAPTEPAPTESAPTESALAVSALAVLPIWYTSADQVEGSREIVRGLGAVQRVTADSGVWTDFTCPAGGLVAVHASDDGPDVELGFEFDGDVESLIPALKAAGIEPVLIDETYSRTLQIPDPDREGRMLWINEKQQDLYGYSQAPA